MRKPSLAFVAAALMLLVGGLSAAPAHAQADSAAADGGTSAPKKKRSTKKSAAPADAAATATAAPAAAPADAAPATTTSKSSKKGKRGKKGQAAAPAPAPAPSTDLAPPPAAPTPPPAPPPATTVMIKTAQPPPPPPASTDYDGPVSYDDDPPTIAHIAITKAMKNKPLVFTTHIVDPSGVFQPVLYLRKRGTGDYLPIKLIGSKQVQGDYAVEVDAKLISVDLEYYIECYDTVGNGPARAGTPESPFTIILEEEKKPVVAKIEEKHVGAPPAITHNTVSKAFRMQPVEINAKLIGDTGVSKATVFFRHSGEHDFRELPMGNIGGDDYTATMPASIVTGDLEYYLEAYDQYGNGPGRSGGPNVPYQITVTEKPPEVVIQKQGPSGPGPIVDNRPPPPHMVKIPFSPNPGRWVGWLFMGGFVASTAFAGGELYGANQADAAYQQTYTYNGQLDNALHQRSIDYTNRAKIFGIAAAASLAVSITLLIIFPEHPDTMIVSGAGGDVTLAKF